MIKSLSVAGVALLFGASGVASSFLFNYQKNNLDLPLIIPFAIAICLTVCRSLRAVILFPLLFLTWYAAKELTGFALLDFPNYLGPLSAASDKASSEVYPFI